MSHLCTPAHPPGCFFTLGTVSSDLLNPSEITPPELRCTRCGGELEIFNDSKTKRLTRHRRRALMKCKQCGELQITSDPIFEKKRHRIARVIAWIGATLFLIVEIVTEHIRFTENPLTGPWFIQGLMTLICAALAGLVCMSTVQVILPGKPKERFGSALSGLLVLALLLWFVWMLHKSPNTLAPRNAAHSLSPPVPSSAP